MTSKLYAAITFVDYDFKETKTYTIDYRPSKFRINVKDLGLDEEIK